MPPSHLTIRDSVQLRADILGLKYDPAEPSATSLSSVLLGIELVNNSLEEHETPRPSRRWTAHLITQACNGTIDGKGDDSQEDCVRACADNSILLGSLESLTNCVMLSTAAKLLRDGSLNVTADDVKILKIFGVHDLASFEDVPVYSSVAQCAVASCHAEALGNCSRIVWSEPDGPSNTTITGIDTFTGILAGLADSCEGFVTTIDADVAGPGVLISHLAQSLMALYAFILIRIFNSWSRRLVTPFSTTSKGAARSTRTASWHRNVVFSRPNVALISSAVEFHEAQAFFVMAMQAATVATFKPSCGQVEGCPELDSVPAIAKSIMSSELLRMLSFDSILPVLLMQSCLQKEGMMWWYKMFFTTTVFVFAIIIQLWTSIPLVTFQELWDHLKAKEPIPQCGGNPPLTTYCLESMPQVGKGWLSKTLMPVACVAMIVLLIDTICHDKRVRQFCENIRNGEGLGGGAVFKRIRIPPWTITLASGLHQLIWALVDFMLLACVSLHLQDLMRISRGVGMGQGQWSYGQLISGTIWAPIVGKYLYYNLFGVKSGFEGRLLHWYKVVDEHSSVFLDRSSMSRKDTPKPGIRES